MKDNNSPYIVEATVTILCNGNPVSGAQIQIEFGFLTGQMGEPYIVSTDTNGAYTIKNDKIWTDPTGKNIDVTIKGNDGEKTKTITIPPKT